MAKVIYLFLFHNIYYHVPNMDEGGGKKIEMKVDCLLKFYNDIFFTLVSFS